MARVGRKRPVFERPPVPAHYEPRVDTYLHVVHCVNSYDAIGGGLGGRPDRVESRWRRNRIPCVPPGEGGTFHFRRAAASMTSAPTSHLLPTYARVDLAFERGEG